MTNQRKTSGMYLTEPFHGALKIDGNIIHIYICIYICVIHMIYCIYFHHQFIVHGDFTLQVASGHGFVGIPTSHEPHSFPGRAQRLQGTCMAPGQGSSHGLPWETTCARASKNHQPGPSNLRRKPHVMLQTISRTSIAQPNTLELCTKNGEISVLPSGYLTSPWKITIFNR